MKKGLFYIILASVLWGTSGIFVHFLAPYALTSIQMTCIRATVGFVCMLFYVLIAHKDQIKTNLKEIPFFIGSGFSFFTTATCYYHAMQLTSISTAVVLMYTAPIFVVIFSVAFLGEKLTRFKTISIVAMFIGCGLVSGIIGGLKFNGLGIIIGFMSGISYALYNILTRIEMQKGISPIKANFYCFFFSMIAGLILSKPTGIIASIGINPPVVLPLAVGVGVVACILPYFLYTLALREVPAGTATSLGILEPLAATIFSVVIFKEALSVFSIVGIILILSAVFILSKED